MCDLTEPNILDKSSPTLDELIDLVKYYSFASKPGSQKNMKEIWQAEDNYLGQCDTILEHLIYLKGLEK